MYNLPMYVLMHLLSLYTSQSYRMGNDNKTQAPICTQPHVRTSVVLVRACNFSFSFSFKIIELF